MATVPPAGDTCSNSIIRNTSHAAASAKAFDSLPSPLPDRTGVSPSGEHQVASKKIKNHTTSSPTPLPSWELSCLREAGPCVTVTSGGTERSTSTTQGDPDGNSTDDGPLNIVSIANRMAGDSRFDFSSTHVSSYHTSSGYSHARSLQQHCRVCFSESSETADLRTCNFCEHRTCVGCFAAWIKAQVNMGKPEITCPSCDVSISPRDLAEFISADTLRKLEYYKSRREHSRNPHAVWCAESTCRELLTITALEKRNKKKTQIKDDGKELTCTRCGTKTCRICQNKAHDGTRCKKPRKTHSGSVKNMFWKLLHARKCPECHIWIEKDGGCSEMECTNCNMSFCFRCGTSYYRINQLSGRTIDGCRCIRVRKNSLRFARAGVFAISLPFLVVALGIGIPAAALLYYASSNDKREVADRVLEEVFLKHNNSNSHNNNLGISSTDSDSEEETNSLRNHIHQIVDRNLHGDTSSNTSSTDSDTMYSNNTIPDEDPAVSRNSSSSVRTAKSNIDSSDSCDKEKQDNILDPQGDVDEDAIVEVTKQVDKIHRGKPVPL